MYVSSTHKTLRVCTAIIIEIFVVHTLLLHTYIHTYIHTYLIMYIEWDNSTGEAYIYEVSPDGGRCVLNTTLYSPVGTNGFFGYSVGIHQYDAIVGAFGYGDTYILYIHIL